jgi:6,7-dimethyl-8-ribityllumazine synthase
MSRFVVVHTSWYQEYINDMKEIILEELGLEVRFYEVPGSLELAAMGKIALREGSEHDVGGNIKGIIFCGVVIRGETTHYELVTTETFREIGNLALDYPWIAIINNVICVENEEQLKIRNKKNTLNNVKALKTLAKSKQDFKGPPRRKSALDL